MSIPKPTNTAVRPRRVVYRHVRDAPPVPVYAAWSKTDPPAARKEVIELLIGLYPDTPKRDPPHQ